MKELLSEIRKCTVCAKHLPLGPRPVIEASANSKIIVVGQAPGTKVHQSGIPWDDQSGKKLREWIGVDNETFYDVDNFGIVPMGFCYPGKGKTGDLPPRKECAETWHDRIFKAFEGVELILLIGTYAQDYFFPKEERNLTGKVKNYTDFLPKYWPLPHPSPVNRFWRSRNPWFENDVVPKLQDKIHEVLQN
ncbi:MAG: uracil-DNA glycosylase family protein [Bacteroidia bacterium]|nr:uracil-DNA glycosylase family protein [Bacteroidia bacterium]NNF31440.1 uracil-DNA glycosylase family protein [Flavobacteriaceae bacterium]MBT8275515.1 uracil-DNA glycosylase family protein [Bacteroidia bacterium]NNJ80887.1 uracil-DNA glycosylase family protein [Flavobacteriaceae bacterium]NNK54019.1 uracil-DNA glycosylase family protein [Flavobacteriaceae bacterium]